MTRAAIYARYSTDKQDESSIHDQLRVCTEYAARNDMQICAQFKDEGISGAATGNRPGFLALIDGAKSGEFNVLLANDLSRLSRSQDLAPFLSRLRHRGVRVIGVQDGFDSDSRTARMQAGLSGIMSEEFRTMVADRTHAALESRAKTKQAVGSCAYGYRPLSRPDGTKWLETVPEEVAVVQRIFQMFAEGKGGKQIAYALNDDGVPSPAKHWKRTDRRTDGKWHPSAIVGDPTKHVGILNNETYTGKLIWNRSKWTKDPDSGKRKRTTLPRSQWVITSAPDLRIVDDVLWQRVRARIELTQARTRDARERAVMLIAQGLPSHRSRGDYKDASNARPGRSTYILSGLLKCGVCGSNYAMADGRKYACATRTNCGPSGCTNDQRVSRKDAERLLLASLRDELANGEYLRIWTDEVERTLREQRQGPAADQATRKQLAEVKARIDRLVDALASGLQGSEAVTAGLREAEAERDRLTRRLESLAQPVPINVRATLNDAAAEFARMLDDLPKQLSDPEIVYEARETLRDWIGDVRIEPTNDGLTAFYRLNDKGLLLTAGPRVAEMVAGAGFEPATFGL